MNCQERPDRRSEGCSCLHISQRQRSQPRSERSQDVQPAAEILERFQVGSGMKWDLQTKFLFSFLPHFPGYYEIFNIFNEDRNWPGAVIVLIDGSRLKISNFCWINIWKISLMFRYKARREDRGMAWPSAKNIYRFFLRSHSIYMQEDAQFWQRKLAAGEQFSDW